MNEIKSIIGSLKTVGGGFYHGYKEDSYVCKYDGIAPTIKANYNLKNSFWVLVNDERK